MFKDRSNYWSSKSENLKQFDAQLISGFQLATQSGPLCEEPMSGVGIRLLEWDLYNDQEGMNSQPTHTCSPLYPVLISVGSQPRRRLRIIRL